MIIKKREKSKPHYRLYKLDGLFVLESDKGTVQMRSRDSNMVIKYAFSLIDHGIIVDYDKEVHPEVARMGV